VNPPSPRLTEAFEYARAAHGAQTRKGTAIPYKRCPRVRINSATERTTLSAAARHHAPRFAFPLSCGDNVFLSL